MKMLAIAISPTDLPSNLGSLVATSWELAVYPDFKVQNYILGRMLESPINKTELNIAIDESKLVNNIIYYRYKYHYANNSVGEWSGYKILEIDGVALPTVTSVIEMPKAESWVDYKEEGGVIKGFLCVKTSPYRDFSNSSIHYKTLCTVTDNINTLLYSEEAIKTSIITQGNLNYFEIPVEIFADNDMYICNITYIGNNGIQSGVLNYTFESYLIDDAINHISEYITGSKITTISKGKVAYFKVLPKTTQFASVNMFLKDSVTTMVVSNNSNQHTIYPKLNIPTTVDSAKVYHVMASVNLLDGTSTTPVNLLSINISENVLRVIDVNATYKDKYSYMGSVDNAGLSVQSTEQLDDGHVLIANTETKSIDMYAIVNEALVFVKKAIVLPTFANVTMMNINIVKMYNGMLLINYGSDNQNVLGQKQVFNMYEYNAGNKMFTLVNQTIISDMGDSTGFSSSLFIAPNNDIYFIPAVKYDSAGIMDVVKLWRIDYNTFLPSIMATLPFNAVRHVSIAPTSNPSKFVVLNGSINQFTVDGRTVWKRENQTVYQYDVNNGLFTDLTIDMSVLPQEMYNVQAYLRKDGKILLFNSSKSGTTIDNQNTALIDLVTKEVTLLNNDLPDNLIYRSTIVLNNGEFIRIVSDTEYVHTVYRYVGNSMDILNAPILENRNEDLIIPAGATVTVDDLSLYGKIIIGGTNLTDSGTLISLDKNLVGEYKYNTLIICGDSVITSNEYNLYERVIILNDANVQLLDI